MQHLVGVNDVTASVSLCGNSQRSYSGNRTNTWGLKMRLSIVRKQKPCACTYSNEASNQFSGAGEALWRRRDGGQKLLYILASLCYNSKGLSDPLTVRQVARKLAEVWKYAIKGCAGFMQHLVGVNDVTASVSLCGNSQRSYSGNRTNTALA
jgi:hypothetical protein